MAPAAAFIMGLSPLCSKGLSRFAYLRRKVPWRATCDSEVRYARFRWSRARRPDQSAALVLCTVRRP
jgi:hypothetical protein